MLVRYFGAAQAATGRDEETLAFTDQVSLAQVLGSLEAKYPPGVRAGAPDFSAVMARSSFLRNEQALRDVHAPLDPEDIIDVLPPFAGG